MHRFCGRRKHANRTGRETVTTSKQTPSLAFITETSPSEATVRAIESGLAAHATGLGFRTDWSPRWIVGRDEGEVVQAGIRFVLAFEWLFVNWLWVADPYRKHEIGSQLMSAAEAAARDHGYRAAYLDPSRFSRRSFTSGSVIGNSAGSMIFRPAVHASGFRNRFADSMPRRAVFLLPPGEGGAIGRRRTPVLRGAMAPDESRGSPSPQPLSCRRGKRRLRPSPQPTPHSSLCGLRLR